MLNYARNPSPFPLSGTCLSPSWLTAQPGREAAWSSTWIGAAAPAHFGRAMRTPRSSQVEAPGRKAKRSGRPIDSRRPNQAGGRQVFWLPGRPSAGPSHPPPLEELRRTVAYSSGRRRSQRRVRGRFTRPSLVVPTRSGHLSRLKIVKEQCLQLPCGFPANCVPTGARFGRRSCILLADWHLRFAHVSAVCERGERMLRNVNISPGERSPSATCCIAGTVWQADNGDGFAHCKS